jgi:hypothetical protein
MRCAPVKIKPMISIIALTLLMAAQSAPAVCDSLTNEEVTALIGTVKSKQPLIGADTCVWNGDRVTFSVMRTPDVDGESATAVLESLTTRARAGDVVTDEPGIGRQAKSEALAKGNSVSIIAVSGTTMWTLRVDHVYSGLKPNELLPKLRTIARKIVK